jgi:uncharacterized OsmC-like protein
MAGEATLLVRHEAGFKFRMNCRDHEFVADLPPSSGGDDTGPTPPELLIAALGSCIGVYAVNYCQKHDIPYEGMTVELSWEDAKAPLRVGTIRARVNMPQGIPEEHYKRFKRAIEACKVHNTLKASPHVEITFG